MHEAATAAEGEGFDGVWLYDHLAGSVHGESRVLEAWTTLTAIAATVPRIAIGPMVLNVANRPAGTLGVMAATLQEVSEGRLLVGLGAGGGRDTPYAAEQRAFGRPVPGDRGGDGRSWVPWRRCGRSGRVAWVASAGSCAPSPRPRSSSAASGPRWPNWPAVWPMG